ncbi:hypothetical protein FB446DRAFT_768767 [Lentinula raphanica]|nr:hypothetical protein FB446DRAFT_768767 [Lentinula raphanica]
MDGYVQRNLSWILGFSQIISNWSIKDKRKRPPSPLTSKFNGTDEHGISYPILSNRSRVMSGVGESKGISTVQTASQAKDSGGGTLNGSSFVPSLEVLQVGDLLVISILDSCVWGKERKTERRTSKETRDKIVVLLHAIRATERAARGIRGIMGIRRDTKESTKKLHKIRRIDWAWEREVEEWDGNDGDKEPNLSHILFLGDSVVVGVVSDNDDNEEQTVDTAP